MAPRWPRRSTRKASAPSAGAPSPAAPSDPNPKPPPAGSSPSARITGPGGAGGQSRASLAGDAVSWSGSASDALDLCTRDDHEARGYYDAVVRALGERLAPPPLPGLADGTMLAVAPVPGKFLEEWRHAALGVWIAWPHATGAIHAEEMTAAQLRAILAERNASA